MPLLQSLNQRLKQAQMMAQGQQLPQGAEEQPAIADQIMQEAQQDEQPSGVDQLQSNMYQDQDEYERQAEGYAGGGIIAFAEPDEKNNYSQVTDPDYVDSPEARRIEDATKSLGIWGAIKDAAKQAKTGVHEWVLGQRQNYDDVRQGAGMDQAQYDDGRGYRNPPSDLGDGSPPQVTPTNKGMFSDYVGQAKQDRNQNQNSDFQTLPYGEDATNQQRYIYARPEDVNVGNTPNSDYEQNAQAGIENLVAAANREKYGAAGQAASVEQPTVPGIPGAQTAAPAAQAAPGAQAVATGRPNVPGGQGTPPTQGAPGVPGIPGSAPAAQAQLAQAAAPVAPAAPSMLDKYTKMLEDQGIETKKERESAKWTALLMGGLGVAGGTSPNALANLSAGALPAIQEYDRTMSGLRKEDAQRLEKLMAAGVSKEKFALEAKKLGIEEKKVANMYEIGTERNRVALIAANARGAGSGDKISAAEDRQMRLLAFNANKELNRVESEVAKMRNSEEYKHATFILSAPFDAKTASPTMRDMRAKAQATVDAVHEEGQRRLNDARSTAEFYNKEAGFNMAPASGAPVTVTSREQRDKLPKGTKYIGADGKIAIKGD